ncbi:hypothetical protein P8452_58207 [Trifolium repens]|nr:hypothetical protein P8452_58207 [Trifolium repens]
MAKKTPTKFSFFSSHLYSLLTITITLSLIPSQIHSSTHQDDIHSLQEIKNAIDPNSVSSSSYINSWDFTVDPCQSTGPQFLGILCDLPLDNSSSRVTAIDLDGIGYEGFLTPAIGNLTELTILNLNNNKFRGPIPETIGKLRKLTRLTLSENFFTGGIPQEISELKKLQYLDLSANRLSGTIPSDMTGHITPLKDLIHLRWLDISDNRISGVIRWDTLSLKGVTHFNVSFNRFTSIDLVNNVGQGQRLRLLEAQGNNLKGHLPVNLVSFTNLTLINLSNNQYHGTIPKEYGTKLRTSWRRLYLDHNFLTGNLPLEFTHTSTYVKGSVANNCLKCPTNIVLCHGGQRPSTECMRQHEI